jgi:hypothetical protein
VILSLTHKRRPKVKAILLPWTRGVFYMRQFVSIITQRRAAAFNFSDSYLCDVNKMYLASVLQAICGAIIALPAHSALDGARHAACPLLIPYTLKFPCTLIL